jgi:prepilin-type N-terminal cleavage/methylation domain-containing protein
MKRSKEQGLSLLEVLVALVILGTLFGGLIALMEQQNSLVSNSLGALHARLLANETMESLKAIPFEDLRDYEFVRIIQPNDLHVQVSVNNFGSDTLKKMIVTVQWGNQQSRHQQIKLSTLRAKYLYSIPDTTFLAIAEKGGTP